MPKIAMWQDTTLRRSDKAPWQARLAIELWLPDDHLSVRFNAQLVVSELVTNVIRHVPAGPQRDWVKVGLGFGNGFVRLTVIDPGTSTPEPRFVPLREGSMEQSGRGLGLVSVLSVRCGTNLLLCGHRVVWADLAKADALPGDAEGLSA
ncbi:ATP-binding protein [Streptosporangium sp. NBC_01495]|uniref:ATP-binding protein n=1 Tax=Streptosporangium sp. NBC_01495 TaxID=2903899 RepID=UPI002E36ECE9|nr:ATP-binding protein [Streptosporangium sp. NBC_01495]